MADKNEKPEKGEERGKPATNYQDQVANQATAIRDAKGEEKPDPSTVAQVEEIQAFGAND